MRVADAVDDPNSMVGEDLACFLGRVVGDQDQPTIAEGLGVMDELPGRGSVGLALDLSDDMGSLAAEPQEEVGPAVAVPRLDDDLQSGDLAEHPNGVCLQATTDVHTIRLIHNVCEYSSFCEYVNGFHELVLASDDSLDALAAALVGVAKHEQLVEPLPRDVLEAAATEGWICQSTGAEGTRRT